MNASASADLLRLIAVVAEPPTVRHAEYAAALGLNAPADLMAWRVAHAAAFIEQCPPYTSTIVGEGGQIGGAAADRVADFRRLLGADVDETPDALPALLADYAELVERATDDARAGHARAALLWEHLLSWVMPYLDALARSAPAPYDGWARLLVEVLLLEAGAVPAPADLPLALRAA
ncbi:MAG: molecular chaperone TorD family protein, partial [Salinisphaera sp.]|uniref:molecular chaperone TorD family protein n=1 Tax=Salinisphaera sp. TaxID=1914330 RepID=UPI003C79EB7F